MTLTREQRASRAWASQGLPVVMLQDMTETEIDSLAALVSEDGKQVDGFREKFLAVYHEYFDARKASTDDPPETEVLL